MIFLSIECTRIEHILTLSSSPAVIINIKFLSWQAETKIDSHFSSENFIVYFAFFIVENMKHAHNSAKGHDSKIK